MSKRWHDMARSLGTASLALAFGWLDRESGGTWEGFTVCVWGIVGLFLLVSGIYYLGKRAGASR